MHPSEIVFWAFGIMKFKLYLINFIDHSQDRFDIIGSKILEKYYIMQVYALNKA